MEDLKKYDALLEDLGEESQNYEKVSRKVQDIEKDYLESGERISSEEEDFENPDDLPELLSEEADFDFSTSEDENNEYSDYDDFDNSPQDMNDNYVYTPDPEDDAIDSIFDNLDTRDYREKRAKGLFRPKFVESENDVIDEEEDLYEDIDEDALEDLFGAPKEINEIHKELAELESYDQSNEISDLDSLLNEARDVIGTSELPELEDLGTAGEEGELEAGEEISEDLSGLEDLGFDEGEGELAEGREGEVTLSEDELGNILESSEVEEGEFEAGEEISEDLSGLEDLGFDEGEGELAEGREEEVTLSEDELGNILESSEVEEGEFEAGEEISEDLSGLEELGFDEGEGELAEGREEEVTLSEDELGNILESSEVEEGEFEAGEEIAEDLSGLEELGFDEGEGELAEGREEEVTLSEDELGNILESSEVEEGEFESGEEVPEEVTGLDDMGFEELEALGEGEAPILEEGDLVDLSELEEASGLEMEEHEDMPSLAEAGADTLSELQDFIDTGETEDEISFDLALEEERHEEEPELLSSELAEQDFHEEDLGVSLEEEIPDEEYGEEEENPVLLSEEEIFQEQAENELFENAGEEEEEENFENWEDELKEIEREEKVSEEEQGFFDEDEEEPVSFQDEELLNHPPDKKGQAHELTDKDLKKIQGNLNKLPINLAMHLRNMLLSPATPAQVKGLITQELIKDYPNIYRLKALSGAEEGDEGESKTAFLPILKYLSLLLVVGAVLTLVYLFLWRPYQENRNKLLAGLNDIENERFDLANDKFKQVNPGLKWYNRYALKFLEKNAYQQAEEKLVGIRDTAYNKIQNGAVDLSPEDKETRLNIAKLYLQQQRFEKVLEDDWEVPGKQYDDSLQYLRHLEPDDFDIVDRIGQVYMSWAEEIKNVPQKKDKYREAYGVYLNYLQQHKDDEVKPLSKILYLSVKLDDNVNKKIDYILSQNYLEQLDHKSLASIGLYYTDKERDKLVNDVIKILNDQKTKEPLAYYMMGNYYLKAEDLDRSERSLVKGFRFNGEYDKKSDKRLRNLDSRLQSRIDEMLGRVYLKLAREYSAPTKFNLEKKNNFVQLSTHHFDRAMKNDPENAMAYFHFGNMQYSYYDDIPKASEYFLHAFNLLKEREDIIPAELYYNLSNSLYTMGDQEKSLEFLSELRASSTFRIRPAIEYLLGLIYYKVGFLEESKEKMNNVLEYYHDEINDYLRAPNPLSIRQNKVFYLNAIIHNNLGCVYNALGVRQNKNEYFDVARVHFYKSIEMGTRYSNKNILALSKVNLNDSIFNDNLRYIENYKVGRRSTLLYDFTPKYLEEYE